MKHTLLLVCFLTLSLSLHAQEKLSYKTNEKNIEFSVSQTEIYVEFIPTQKNAVQQYLKQGFTKIAANSAIIKTADTRASFQEQKQNLQSKFPRQLKRIEPVLVYRDGTRQIAKGELNIKLKPNISINEVLKGYDFNSQPNKFEKDLYLVSTHLKTAALFAFINQLQSDNRIEFVEPNFIRMIKPHTNDPFFSSQWSINNQGYLGGTVDADMDVNDAWNYTTGTGIVVAVIGGGVDLSHPDLTANLLNGYDATGNGSNGAPNEATDDAHGTSCAGIIAAIANNTKGTAGIAYDAKILPVRIGYSNGLPLGDINRAWITHDNWVANGINWAWQNGADVLSNSYGIGSYSSTIENAINNAVNNGRNGKGSVVLFSSGNDNGSVSFPASVNNAIAVGASSMCDERKSLTSCDGELWGSNYGTSLDVVAPGVKIYTTDISGSNGYKSDNYMSNFSGTSAACPNTAGVVALILSANPNLTQQEAREILESSVDKVGGYNYANTSGQPNGTWNNQVGYGRVNALKAVEKAIYGNTEFIGSSTLCIGESATFTLNPTSNTTPTWNVSSNLIILSQSQNSITVKPTSSSTNGAGYIEATFQTQTIKKDIWIGKPRITSAKLDDGQYLSYGSFPNQVCKLKQINTDITLGGADSASWSLVNSSQTVSWSQQGNNLSLYLWNINQTATFRITLNNECGTFTRDFTFTAKDCSGDGNDPCDVTYLISPNPTSTNIEITPNIPAPCDSLITALGQKTQYTIATLYDFNGNPVLAKSPAAGTMNVKDLSPGYYILVISTNGKKESHTIVIR